MDHQTPHFSKSPKTPPFSYQHTIFEYTSPSYVSPLQHGESRICTQHYYSASAPRSDMGSTLGLPGIGASSNGQSILDTSQSWKTANTQYGDSSVSRQTISNVLPAEYDPFAPYTPSSTPYSTNLYSSTIMEMAPHPIHPLPSGTTSQRSSFSSAPLSEVITQAGSVHSFTPRIKTEEPTDFSLGSDTLVLSPPHAQQGLLAVTGAFSENLEAAYYHDQSSLGWGKGDYSNYELPSISSLPIPQYDRRAENQDRIGITSAPPQRKMSNSVARTRQPRRLTTKEEANFQCTVKGCGKLFGRSYNYKAHMETHDTTREYPFPCTQPDCDKKFVRKTDLQRHHQSVHMKQRNFKCDYCSRLFARKDTLRRHMEDGCSKRFDIEVVDYQAQKTDGSSPINILRTQRSEDISQQQRLPPYPTTAAYTESVLVHSTQVPGASHHGPNASLFPDRHDYMIPEDNSLSTWHGS